jgi:hypothetical protein
MMLPANLISLRRDRAIIQRGNTYAIFLWLLSPPKYVLLYAQGCLLPQGMYESRFMHATTMSTWEAVAPWRLLSPLSLSRRRFARVAGLAEGWRWTMMM